MVDVASESMPAITEKSSVHEVRWARLVSDVLSPPVVWAVMTFPIALRDADSHARGVVWALVYVVLVCVLPVVYIAWLVAAGEITDMHLPHRHERTRPFIATILCALVALIVLKLMNSSSKMDFYALSTLMQISLLAMITLVWQISIHTMSISGVVVTVAAWFSVAIALVLIPLVLLVAGARLRLKRHTPAQVVAGIVVGSASVSFLLWVIEIV